MNTELWLRHAWPSMLETVRAHRPLTRAEAVADYAWLERTSSAPGRLRLMERWGWTDYKTRCLLDEMNAWPPVGGAA
jgi:hypothetical protein